MRCLIAIGCDVYDDRDWLSPLQGAGNDARKMYAALLKPEIGDYDAGRSRLLLSPTLDEVRRAIVEVLHSGAGPIDTFTFFFAGHGSVGANSMYLWVKDSLATSAAGTAYSLSNLFLSIAEARPAQTNIIIDACESGGVVNDLGTVVRPDSLGPAGSPSISVLVTSASNQSAQERGGSGLGTELILDCIEGRRTINDHQPTLDLFEIGRTVAPLLEHEGQSPASWGLNITGAPRFCRNPRYGSDPNLALRQAIQDWPSDGSDAVRPFLRQLWAAYNSIDEAWNAATFITTVRTVAEIISQKDQFLAQFIDRFSIACAARAATASDAFREAEVYGCLATAVLRVPRTPPVADLLTRLQEATANAAARASLSAVQMLAADRFALLSPSGAISDLFLLPLRVSQCLGWASYAYLATPSTERAKTLSELASFILAEYALNVVAMSDTQAPATAVTLRALHQLKRLDLGEQLASLLFNSLSSHGGSLARTDIDEEKVVDYLLARSHRDFSRCIGLLEQPTELLTVLITCAGRFGLEDTFDDDLWTLDHVFLAAYVTSDFKEYGDSRMENGDYRTWQIGADIFCCADLTRHWGDHSVPEDAIDSSGAIVGSLLHRDRSPWFLITQDQ
ncbi:caspase family protein [Luteibacter sp. PPL552]